MRLQILLCLPFLVWSRLTLAATLTGPVTVGGDKMGAITYELGDNTSFIVYQATDTSLYSLVGKGRPVSPSGYTQTQILGAGIARNDTPLAVVYDRANTPFETPLHVFYLTARTCTGGNLLAQLSYNTGFGPGEPSWSAGSLNALNICSSATSNFLYALPRAGCPQGFGTSGCTEPLRVGYLSAGGSSGSVANQLTEAWAGAGTGWNVATF